MNLRNLVAWQCNVLLQADRRLREGKVEIHPVLERHPHEGQPVKRGRADVGDARGRIQADFHRKRVVMLHLLSRKPRSLRRDLQDHRGGVGVSLDVELGEGEIARPGEHEQAQHDDRTPAEAERDESFKHGFLLKVGNDCGDGDV